jgi:glycine/D-amino acid oxidase-like deaminating enzyme
LNAAAVAAAEPALARLPRGAGALAVASDAQIDGRGACDALKAACEREGGGRFEVVASRRVAAVERASDGRAVGVRFDDATDPLPATTAVVVAAGAWTGEVLAASGVGEAWAGAFAPRKGHLIEVDAPPLSLTAGTMEAAYGAHYGGAAVEATGAFALTDDERARGVVFTAAPTADGARLLLGSSRDDGAGFDAGVDEAAVAAILARAGRFVPAARGARVVGVRVGLRPTCRFGAPVVGALTSWNAPNLYVAAGHEGSGLLLAAGTARAVAGGVFGGGGEEEAAVWAEFAPETVAGELLSV